MTIVLTTPEIICPKCKSSNVIKGGVRYNGKQRYVCKDCDRWFQEPEPEDFRSCANCKNKGSDVCREWLYEKKRYPKRHDGSELKKKYCKYWVYKPKGIWATPKFSVQIPPVAFNQKLE